MRMPLWNAKNAQELNERIEKKKSVRLYADYYEDFITYSVPDGKKNRIVRVYAGKYRCLETGEIAFRKRKGLYGLLWLASATLFALAATRELALFSQKPFVLMQLLAVLALGWCLVNAVSYLLAPVRMTEYAYKSFGMLKAASAFAVAMLCVNGIAVLAGALAGGGDVANVALSAAGCLLSACAMAVLNRVENTAIYTATASTDQPPEGAIKLR